MYFNPCRVTAAVRSSGSLLLLTAWQPKWIPLAVSPPPRGGTLSWSSQEITDEAGPLHMSGDRTGTVSGVRRTSGAVVITQSNTNPTAESAQRRKELQSLQSMDLTYADPNKLAVGTYRCPSELTSQYTGRNRHKP